MRVAILGAGAVGGYYGGVLARAGHRVVMLARGAHLEALRKRGIEIRTPEGTFFAAVDAVADPRELGAAELAVVAVKNYSLAEISPAVRLVAEAGATVLPLLNGVEVVDRLAAAGVPAGQVLGGLSEISAARIGPGLVERRSPFQRVVLGETAGGTSERAERIAAAFRQAGVDCKVSDDIAVDIWRKFAFITAMAAACGLARSPVGPIRETPLGHLLIERAVGEVVAVARARGIALPGGAEEQIVRVIDSMPAAMKPSFLLDFESGGPTELDDLCGAVSRLARPAAVETPIHDTATAALGIALGVSPSSRAG
ncbi:MAG TPA: ketopantoate reductase family protein [Thermoanaerobaculia bacterium]|nr:ketopantoate reductase family protein [Thermoanaerobaculia bacterium]